MKLLLAEDNVALRVSLVCALEAEGYSVEATGDGAECLYRACNMAFDLLVLDINMPGLSGFQVAEELRRIKDRTPILFLTARDSVEDRVKGLNLGGDDYLVKPFSLEELLARIRVLLRRNMLLEDARLAYVDVVLLTDAKKALFRDTETTLTSKEYEILEYFIINKGRTLSRDQILQRIWGSDSYVGYGTIEVHIHNLRLKMNKEACVARIKNVRGLGYVLE